MLFNLLMNNGPAVNIYLETKKKCVIYTTLYG
jgi:hypothetical protein